MDGYYIIKKERIYKTIKDGKVMLFVKNIDDYNLKTLEEFGTDKNADITIVDLNQIFQQIHRVENEPWDYYMTKLVELQRKTRNFNLDVSDLDSKTHEKYESLKKESEQKVEQMCDEINKKLSCFDIKITPSAKFLGKDAVDTDVYYFLNSGEPLFPIKINDQIAGFADIGAVKSYQEELQNTYDLNQAGRE